MTPAQIYAQKREEAIELIRTHAPPRLQDALIELLRPAIALSATRADDAQIPLGASKFGGAPDVPVNFEWPLWNDKPLGFLAQINLEEVAPFDVEELLPKSGLLSFFYDFEKQPWGSYADKGAWAVCWIEEINHLTNSPGPAVDSCSIQFSGHVHLADFIARREVFGERMWEVEEELNGFHKAYSEATDEQEPAAKAHQLLGIAAPLQGWMQTECELESQAKSYPDFDEDDFEERIPGEEEWILLLQVDSDKSIGQSWGDLGRLYFWIRQRDLRARQFQNCWIQLQCG